MLLFEFKFKFLFASPFPAVHAARKSSRRLPISTGSVGVRFYERRYSSILQDPKPPQKPPLKVPRSKPPTMDVIALTSGGKDSFFSLLHCIANGHRVVALANLHPPTPNIPSSVTTHLPTTAPHIFISPTSETKDELDSFMYQTVGHSLLPFYPNALGVPLYRYPITGSSVNQNLSYKFSALGEKGGDETEDLLPLLKHILERHPSVKAISTGTILSTYQRTRIESVCDRLGLTSLSYLWQRPQSALLEEMNLVGLDARIVKVAAVGLDAKRWVWRNVADVKTRMLLEGLQKKWGVHMAGEGGEYETIVVDGPGWKGRIEVEEGGWEIIDGGGGVGHLKVLGARFVEREGRAIEQEEWVKDLKRPGLWDTDFKDILKTLEVEEKGTAASQLQSIVSTNGGPKVVNTCINQIGKLLFITNVGPGNNFTGTVPEEICSIMDFLRQQLEIHKTDFSHITSTTLLLRSMSDFATVNATYSSYFNTPNPPSRVCVSVGPRMPAETNIMLSCTVDLPATSPIDEEGRRKGLHVQSRSYWAPANIGPYSQAINVDGWTALAGMIPLVPGTMEVVNGGVGEREVQEQAVLALQHMWRVAKAVDVATLLGCVAYVVNDTSMQAAAGAWRELWKGWKGEGGWRGLFGANEEGGDEGDDDEADIGGGIRPPLLIASVEELPRTCAVEWAGIGLDPAWIQRMKHNHYTDDDNGAAKSHYRWGVKPGTETSSNGLITSSSMFYGGWTNDHGIPLPSGGGGVSVLCFPPPLAGTEAERCAALAKEVSEEMIGGEIGFSVEEIRVYIPATTGTAGEFSEAWDHMKSLVAAAVMIVPVGKVWDCDGTLAGLGVVVRRVGPQLG